MSTCECRCDEILNCFNYFRRYSMAFDAASLQSSES